MHLPVIFALAEVFAFGPAALLGLVAVALTTWAFKLNRRPVLEGRRESRRTPESTLIILVTLAWIACLVCVALGAAAIEAAHMFDGWATQRRD